MLRAALASRTLFLLLALASPGLAHGRAPLASERVADALAEVERLGDGEGLLRLVSLLEHLDALTPEAALAGLTTLAEGRSLRSARAALELATLRSGYTPPSIATKAMAVAELAPDDDLIALHRRFAASAVATLGERYLADDPTRGWMLVDEGPRGAIALDELVPSGGRVVLHVVVQLYAKERVEGFLRLGATGDLVASITYRGTGQVLGSAQALERAVADQLEVPLTLPAGEHQLLVTLRPNASEPALLRLRFDGGEVSSGWTASRRWAAFDVPASVPALPWNADVRRLTATRPLEGLALARFMGLPDLVGARPGKDVSFEERLASATLGARDFLLLLGAVRRPEDRASLLLSRLERDAAAPRGRRDPVLLLALAEHTADRGQLVQAGELVREAAQGLDDDVPEQELVTWMRARLARLAHAPEEVLIAYGVADPSLAPEVIRARVAPLSERARLDIAQAALDIGLAERAHLVIEVLAGAEPGRLDLAIARMRAAVAAGRGDVATQIAERLAVLRPDRPALALDAADKLLTRGGPAERERALALVITARKHIGWKPDALVDAGRLFEQLDDRAAAIAAYAQALSVSPAHEGARRDLERLQGAEPVPLTLTIDQVAKAPVVNPEASFEVLGEEQRVKVFADGSATTWTRRFLRAQTVPEAREARTLFLRFDPTRESMRVLAATVRRANADGGGIGPKTPAEPVPDRLLQSIAEDWYGLYYDLRQLAIPFDHLKRGDIIEVTWRSDPVGQLFPGVVDLFELLADRVPKHLHRIVVDVPPGLTLTTRLSIPDGMRLRTDERVEQLADGGARHMIEVRDVPGLPVESLAPGSAEVSPVWQATTFTSWREVATWYRRLVEPQKVLSPAMKAFVADVVRPAAPAGKPPAQPVKPATPGEILGRLVDYVTREIRYVGLEFGIHGFKPYRTDQVWSRRFGDCKDKATLLTALMAEAGLAGEVTLLRSRKQGRLAGALPSLSLFDHAVVYVRSRDELVDPTATYYGLGELPKDDQGAQVLVLTPPGEHADLAISRNDPPSRNGVTGTYSVTLEARGNAGIQGTVAFLGTQAPPYRALLLDPASQKLRLAELMNRRFPGLTLRDFRISDPLDRTKPFELVFHAEVPRFGQLRSESDGTLQVTRPTGIDGHVERYASTDERHLPLVLGPPMSWDVTYRYILPAGHRARTLPKGGEASGPFGSYRVTWLEEGQTVTVRVELAYLVDQVAPADYAGLRDFVRGFDAVVAPPLVFAKGVNQ